MYVLQINPGVGNRPAAHHMHGGRAASITAQRPPEPPRPPACPRGEFVNTGPLPARVLIMSNPVQNHVAMYSETSSTYDIICGRPRWMYVQALVEAAATAVAEVAAACESTSPNSAGCARASAEADAVATVRTSLLPLHACLWHQGDN